MKRKSMCSIAIASLLAAITLCGCAAAEADAVGPKASTDYEVHNLNSTVTRPKNGQDISAIDVQATIGYLTVAYGDKPQIEIGPKLADHASVSWDNGMLTYRDDFAEHNLSFDEIDSEDCKIAITLPTGLTLKTLSIELGIGMVHLQNVTADTALFTGAGKINLDGFHSQTLELNSTLADISAADISIQKELRLLSYGSTAVISGNIRGKVLIDSAGISNTEILFVGAKRDDYAIQSAWRPGSGNREAGELLLKSEEAGIMIDGERHSLEYTDSNSAAPYQLEIVSREFLPMKNIDLKFLEQVFFCEGIFGGHDNDFMWVSLDEDLGGIQKGAAIYIKLNDELRAQIKEYEIMDRLRIYYGGQISNADSLQIETVYSIQNKDGL